MIEIQNDALHISFPAIASEIEKLVKSYIAETIPLAVTEDRQKIYNQFFNIKDTPETPPKNLDEIPLQIDLYVSHPEYKAKVRELIFQFSQDDIARELEKRIRQMANTFKSGRTATAEITFSRTLRIPDDGKSYPLPPLWGDFPLRHVDDYTTLLPSENWLERGGVMMPMYQTEALCLCFASNTHYGFTRIKSLAFPFAIKVASGKINSVSGEPWKSGLQTSPQDYVVTPGQPWLDGFAIAPDTIRQFVAMPLGSGHSVEEQITGKSEFGGLQIQVTPMKAENYFRSILQPALPKSLREIIYDLVPNPFEPECCCGGPMMERATMALGAGGKMSQQIYKDPYKMEDWALDQTNRCFVHLCNALEWRSITGENPPQKPITAQDYEMKGLPWFNFYHEDLDVLEGSKSLADIKSVNSICLTNGEDGLSDNKSVATPWVVDLSPKLKKVKEWTGE